MLVVEAKLKNASFLGAFLFIRLKKQMTINKKADKKVGCGGGGGGGGVWGVGRIKLPFAFCLLHECLLPPDN